MRAVEFDYECFMSYNAAIMAGNVENGERELKLPLEIELGKEYFPFVGEDWGDLSVTRGVLSEWKFKFGELNGGVTASLAEPFFEVHGDDELEGIEYDADDTPAFPLGSTNYEGSNIPEQAGVMFSLNPEFDSLEKYNWVKNFRVVFSFGDQKYLLGFEGDGLIDDGEDFNDTEELYNDLNDGKLRKLSNYRMYQSSKGHFQVAVPRNSDLSKISVKFYH